MRLGWQCLAKPLIENGAPQQPIINFIESISILNFRQVNGELFALTGKYFPFTGPINETYTMMVKEQQDRQRERNLNAKERQSVFERIRLRFLRRYFP